MNEGKSASRNVEAGLIVVVIIILLGIGIPSLLWTQLQSNQDNTILEPSHRLTMWLQPTNSSLNLHINFYSAESDVGTTNRMLAGLEFSVDSGTPTERVFPLINLPEDAEGFWVEVYIQEGLSATAYLSLGVKKAVPLTGYPVDMLIEHWTT